jgi:RNA polymerase sigma-70 factor (ECF subfamily)
MEKERLTYQFQGLSLRMHQEAMMMLHEEQEAEDAVQDTYVRALESDITAVEDAKVKRFLLTTLKNRCLDILRRKKPVTPIDNADICGASYDMDACMRVNDLKRVAISELSALQYDIFRLRVFHDLEFEEIARKLNISTEAARMNMSRARRKLLNYKI